MKTRPGLRLALAAVLLGTTPAQAIQGGAPARGGDALAQATVAVGTVLKPGDDLKISQCTGVLIGRSRVMTAAHCVRDNPIGAVVVFYRGSRPSGPAYSVASVSRYAVGGGDLPSGDLGINLAALALDVAVLRLAEPVRDRNPVPLARRGGRMPATLELAGIGLSGNAPGMLRTTTLRPIAVTESGLTIARAVGSLVCIGDSGGPVVERGRGVRLWGVASAVITSQPPCGSIVVIAPAT
jgi:hypothetical protein